jgi:hypothetical protein
MHHCVSCSNSDGGSTNRATNSQNLKETIYDCRHIRSDGFMSYAFDGTIHAGIDETESLFSETSDEATYGGGDSKASRQQPFVTVYENTIIIEPLQDVVILTVYNNTTEDDVILEQGTTTVGTVPKGPKQSRNPPLKR